MENVQALHFALDAELVGRVVEHSYENRLPSRTEAIRFLPDDALSAAKPAKKEAPTKKVGKK